LKGKTVTGIVVNYHEIVMMDKWIFVLQSSDNKHRTIIAQHDDCHLKNKHIV
jgi:hypothetical protein